MKKLLSLLLCLTLSLAVLPVQAEQYVDTPFGEAAYQLTLVQYGTLYAMFDTQDARWEYNLSQGPNDQGDIIRYATHDLRYEAAFVADARATGVEEVHLLFNFSMLQSDSTYDIYLMTFSMVALYVLDSGRTDAGDFFTTTLMNQLADVAVNSTSTQPYQTSRVLIGKGLYMSCYRNGADACVLLEFEPVATTTTLRPYLLNAVSLIPADE